MGRERRHYLLAVSGGPDSMALLHYFFEKGYVIEVAHVNYQRRDTADHDAQLVIDYCDKRSIPCHLRFFPKDVEIGNFQKEARDFRYQFFQELMIERDLDVLLTAHHFDDVLETYVFQKRRQMLSESVGIAEHSRIFNMDVWRPFLKYSKQDLIDYCHNKNVPYAIDESNLTLDYTRNQIRDEISQMSSASYQKLVENYQNDFMMWEKKKEERRKIVKSWDFVVSYESYAKIKDSERFLYLRDWLIQEGVQAHAYSKAYLQDLDRQILGRKIHRSFGDYKLCYSYGEIAIYQEKTYFHTFDTIEDLLEKNFSFLQQEELKRIRLKANDFPLVLRNFHEGDRIEMEYGGKKLSRFFIDEKIPLYKRASWPVLLNAQGEVIYVPQLGVSVSFL